MKPGLALAGLLLAATPAYAADWLRVETPNFIVFGETGERRLREVAGEFERFREALARIIPGAATPAAVPTVVVVFGSHRAFEPYRPRFNGKPIELGAYFYASEDMNIVTLADVDRENTLRTILHEYVHLVVANGGQEMPAWLGEGLAEYYSTFQVSDGGRRAVVGRVIPSHLYLLNTRRPMSIQELLAVEQSSSAYNEGERQSLFYAQSWALVHMLMSGTPNRAAALGLYARLVAGGTPSLAAWRQAFGDQNIIRELELYVGREVMQGTLYRFDRDLPRLKGDASRLSQADKEAVLGDLLRRVATPEEATARLEQAAALQPPSEYARAVLGLIALEGDRDTAEALLLGAASNTADWLVQYQVAAGLTRLASERSDPTPAVVHAARAATNRVLAARPDLPHAQAFVARLDATDDATLSSALGAIRRARALAPGREDYVLFESFILTRREEYGAARQLLGPLLTTRYPASVREHARSLMLQIVRRERADEAFLAQLEGRRPSTTTPSAAGETQPSPSRHLEPDYRRLEAGEQRTEGLLERIDCSATGVTFILRSDRTIERFTAARMEAVAFVSYRDDLVGVITCGQRRPADRVYITWRPDNTSRRVVAVEFLPP